MKKKFIVITSIFQPTAAVKKFARFKDWQVIVVGDRKTPKRWKHKNVIYISPEQQEKLGYEICKYLLWNHYARKMVGYLYAMEHGAEIIYDTDDDNIPTKAWHAPAFSGKFTTLSGAQFVNVYDYFTKQKVWPRGLPLDVVNKKQKIASKMTENNVGMWQCLADVDPDVDAIYRLIDNTPVHFDKRAPIVLDRGTSCPTNSQNTFFSKEFFHLLFLPTYVSFRFTDILRGYVAQPLIWSQNKRIGFTSATVTQKRNEHDYFKDFLQEVPVYMHSRTVCETASAHAHKKEPLESLLMMTYTDLMKKGIVIELEIELLKAWIKDIKRLQK